MNTESKQPPVMAPALEVQLREQAAAIDAALDGIAILDDRQCHTYMNAAHAHV